MDGCRLSYYVGPSQKNCRTLAATVDDCSIANSGYTGSDSISLAAFSISGSVPSAPSHDPMSQPKCVMRFATRAERQRRVRWMVPKLDSITLLTRICTRSAGIFLYLFRFLQTECNERGPWERGYNLNERRSHRIRCHNQFSAERFNEVF